MRKVILVFLFLILIFPVRGEVIHNLSLKDNEIFVNSTLILKSDNSLDYWNLEIMLPEKIEIVGLKDEIGNITYNFSENQLEFRTNRKRAKTRIVNLVFKKNLEEESGFKIADLNLFGFENDTTTIISPNFPYFFIPNAQVEYGEKIKAKKRGAARVRIIFDGKKESSHYLTNSNLNLSLLENYYWIPEGITGLKIPVKFGIVVLQDEEYNKKLEYWSSGTFRDGIIFVRENLSKNEKITTILHETTHGFNSFALDWDKTNISWFDEGVACYVTSVMSRLLNETKPQIFGEEVKWREGRTIYSLKPNLKPEDLFDYYNKREKWVLSWHPGKYKENYRRNFGYAYSELFIREYLKENGSALHRVYQRLLNINKSIESKDKRNKIILNIFEKEFRPCYSLNLKGIKNCTKELNKMSFEIPQVDGKEIDYEVAIPELPEVENYSFIDLLIQRIKGFFGSLTEKILSLF